MVSNMPATKSMTCRAAAYNSLNDVAVDTGDISYMKGRTEIWYLKEDFIYRNGKIVEYTESHITELSIPKVKANLPTYYTLIGKIGSTDPQWIFEKMQAENWARNYGAANRFLDSIGASHTSMSEGDLIVYGKKGWIVARGAGFDEIAFMA